MYLQNFSYSWINSQYALAYFFKLKNREKDDTNHTLSFQIKIFLYNQKK
jgi:hypothetical protein